ncbi:MAG: heat shock protein transcriptional repressor HspR [Solirubrobacteraceae bacterium]
MSMGEGDDMRERGAVRLSGEVSGELARGGETLRVLLETDRGVFMISVAAELANMHPQTLRTYEARGLIAPQRSPKGTRLYSQRDVEKLRRIQEMTAELGLNLAGVERVMALEAEVNEMNRRIEELEVQALAAEARLADELEAVRRSFRAELVPYRGSGRQVVLASEARAALRPARPAQRQGGGGAIAPQAPPTGGGAVARQAAPNGGHDAG